MNNGLEMRFDFLFTHLMKLRTKVWYSSFTSLRIIGSLFFGSLHINESHSWNEYKKYSIRSNKRAINKTLLSAVLFNYFSHGSLNMKSVLWVCIWSDSLLLTKYEINSSYKDLIKENCHCESDFLEFLD